MSENRKCTRMMTTIAALTLWVGGGGLFSPPAYADEGGVSFWFPGQFGSLAAVPAEPGWSLPLIYYHNSSDASGSREFAPALPII